MKRSFTALSILALMASTACSSPAPVQDGPTGGAPKASVSAVPTQEALPAGAFQLTTYSGAVIKFTLPTPATDPAVAELEAFRTKANGAPVTYLVADVDNRQGTELVNMYMVSAFDEPGHQYKFSTVTKAIDSWKPSYGSDGKYTLPDGTVLDDRLGSDLNGAGVTLYNANLGDVSPAERKTVILASTDVNLPSEFTRVSVQPSGMGQGEDANPAAG